MLFVIRDLDTGLFLDKGAWTVSPKFAQHFQDQKAVERAVFEHQIKNAEMVFLNDSLEVTGGTFMPLPPAS